MIGLNDVFGELANSAQEVSPLAILFSLFFCFILSLIILIVYRNAYQTTVYNRSFAISLPIVSMVTAVIIISVSSNIILSLGMVGALSIVRFRTALKNPFDTVFMFWAVGLGITIGAGLVLVASIATFVIALVVVLLIALEVMINSYFLIIRVEGLEEEEKIMEEIKQIYGKVTVRNKTIKGNKLELTIEVRSNKDNTLAINKLRQFKSITNIILLSHQGDYIAE